MNQLTKIFLCAIFLISCTETKNVSEIPVNRATATKDIATSSQELLPLTPSATPKSFEKVFAGTPIPVVESTISPENVNNIVEFARWGNGIIQKLIISPDEKFVIISSSIGFYVFSYEDFRVVKFVELNSDIGDLAISPDGQLLAVSTREKLLIYKFSSLDLLNTIERSATNLVFSPDGKILAMGMGDWNICRESGPVELWDVGTWTLLQTMGGDFDCIGDLIFSPSGKYLAVSNFDITLWELAGNEYKLKFRNGGCDLFEEDVAFSNDEKKLFVATRADSGRDNICLIDITDGKTLGVLENESMPDYSCQPHIIMSPDGKFMAANFDGKISIWQIDELKRIQNLGEEKECAYSGGWLSDNKTLFTLSNQQFQIWNVPNEELVYSEFLSKQPLPINVVEWSQDGKTLATGNKSGVVSLWQVSNGIVFKELKNQGNITSLAFSPNNSLLAVGLETDQANIWDLSNETEVQTLNGVSGYGPTRVKFSADGAWLALDIEDSDVQLNKNDVQIWKTDDWTHLFTLTADGYFSDLSISPDNKLLSASDSEAIISVWNLQTKEIIYEFNFPRRIVSLDFSPNSRYLAVSKRDGGIGVWDLDNGKLLYTYENPDLDSWKGVYYLYDYDNFDWSPDGQLIAVAMPNGSISLIRANDGVLLKKLLGHTLGATGISFSPDGKIIASVSFDGTVRLWGINP